MFQPHSPETLAIAGLFQHFLILAAIVFLLVSGLVSYAVVRYRAGASPNVRSVGSRRLELLWTGIPLLVVIVFFILTVRTMAFIDAPLNPSRDADIVVTGRQWWWEARYPNGVLVPNEIHIPAGIRLLVRVESTDVIHDFWVPQLARKMDAVPGRTGFLWLRADMPGTYQGTCSEFCGMQHAGMRFQVVAESEHDFAEWLVRQAQAQKPLPAEGARIFEREKCGDCHSVSGIQEGPRRGPSLAHIATRRLLGGELPNTTENLTAWILSPQSIKPGNHMPNQRMDGAGLTSLVAYLEALR